ncbi:uncharacterized protein LOC141593876 [Silene latifolia]|uniref:uncharacterized protein LOC141593876 n=1 Tax=Silene latifolia TaxID=37657 RepID=UPI003D78208E
MSKVLKMQGYDSEKEEEESCDEEDFEEEEEEEEEESNEFDDEFEEKVVEKFDPNTITVKVQKLEYGPNYQKFMKIDKDIELRWLMIHYCEKMGMEYRNTKFMFNGASLRTTDTPLKLSMVNGDVISVGLGKSNQGVDQRSPIWYRTLCIRAHKRRDTFVRVARDVSLLRSIKRNFSDSENGKHDSTCFFYKGLKLTDIDTVNMLRIEDGDIIDAFNFNDNRSSLSFVSGLPSTLHEPPAFKRNPDINKSGPRKHVLGTPGTRPRPRETQLHNNTPVQQQTTRPRPPPVNMSMRQAPPYTGMKRVPY